MIFVPTLSAIAEVATAVGTIITSVGVIVAARQLRLSQKQALTTFEETLAQEYRELTTRLPTKALLGEELTEKERNASFDEFYHYFDLSNEQVFLRQINRVSAKTWMFWRDGIRGNLRRPAFTRAWEEISTRAPSDFTELRRLIQGGYEQDPCHWGKNKPLLPRVDGLPEVSKGDKRVISNSATPKGIAHDALPYEQNTQVAHQATK